MVVLGVKERTMMLLTHRQFINEPLLFVKCTRQELERITIIGTNFIVNWKWKEVKDDAIYHNFIR